MFDRALCYGFPTSRERQWTGGRVLLFVALTLGTFAHAQQYPTRPIRLIVPFAAGGTAVVIARNVATEAGAQLGQPFVLDNRGGANGIIGADIVAKAPPDGQTLLHVTASFVINPDVSGGYEPDGRSPAEFRKFLRLEYDRYAEMVRVANVPKTAH